MGKRTEERRRKKTRGRAIPDYATPKGNAREK
jgi:hypothetical protein